MDNIGAEVSQKMRSAIKAKLMELDCYVDDELPDYIMVMVANKRTKSQMNEDLNLFLTTKTSTFVDWLHIVLKKLKEVHVTNPDVYAKAVKRKVDDVNPNIKIKKEKRDKKVAKKQKSDDLDYSKRSLTDDLPITANKLTEAKKIIEMKENENNVNHATNDDNFDIPLLSEVNMASEQELEMLEKQIKSVKSRLGIQIESEESESEDEDFINIKAEPEELFPSEKSHDKRQRKVATDKSTTLTLPEPDSTAVEVSTEPEEPLVFKHARITFENSISPSKKPSILERLGKRSANNKLENHTEKRNLNPFYNTTSKDEGDTTARTKKDVSPSPRIKDKLNSAGTRRNDTSKNDKNKILQFEKPRESVLSRLGIMSKVSIPDKPKEPPPPVEDEVEEEEEQIVKEVPSVVKVKPRVLPPRTKQANKTLLLKAVADAQRSVAQTPTVGNIEKFIGVKDQSTSKSDKPALFTKKYHERMETVNKQPTKRKLLDTEKAKLKNIIVHIARDDNQEYVPQPVRKTIVNEAVSYTPTAKQTERMADTEDVQEPEPVVNHKFIVTLDGLDKEKFLKKDIDIEPVPVPVPVTVKKPPSPIIFVNPDDTGPPDQSKKNVPDVLPVVSTLSLKNKERCKYWPTCKQGEKCEFIHPSSTCKAFPSCKFGDKCLYIHPTCKFEASCTRRDCPYSHASSATKLVASRIVPPATPLHVAKQSPQTCKFFPNCTNIHCTFYHPKPCKFGKFCKNQSECNFSHVYLPKSSNMTWRPDKV